MWPRKPEMPQPLRDWPQGATEDRGWGMGRSLLAEALGLPGRVAGRGQAGKRLRSRVGSCCCQPARLQPDLPAKLRRAIFS